MENEWKSKMRQTNYKLSSIEEKQKKMQTNSGFIHFGNFIAFSIIENYH